MELNCVRLGQRIKAIRKQRKMSQMALSEIIDCSPNYLSYIENGYRSMSLTCFVRLVNALGASADELLMDSLDHVARAMDHKLSSVLADCDEYERRVLFSFLSAAKEAIRENRCWI